MKTKLKRITLSLVSEMFIIPLIWWHCHYRTLHIIKQSPLTCRHRAESELRGNSGVLQARGYDEYLMQHLTTY